MFGDGGKESNGRMAREGEMGRERVRERGRAREGRGKAKEMRRPGARVFSSVCLSKAKVLDGSGKIVYRQSAFDRLGDSRIILCSVRAQLSSAGQS